MYAMFLLLWKQKLSQVKYLQMYKLSHVKMVSYDFCFKSILGDSILETQPGIVRHLVICNISFKIVYIFNILI